MLTPRWPQARASITACLAALLVNNVFSKPAGEKYEPWDPNYCNDTKVQESAGLTKTALGQFLGYPCDTIFFHCRWGVDGWRSYKKTCRKGLVYDTTGTQNCNYDFNVDGCGMKQCADCLGDQYACCLSEECVDFGMRCDGKYDCTLEEDEQNCPTCATGQFACVLSEQCIDIDKRCNGIKECKDGTDEHHCDECGAGNFFCRNSKKCIELKLRCDGKRDCNMGEDEAFCGPEEQKEYICEDQVHTVPKPDVCNGVDDCPDGSDEQYCISSNIEVEESSSAIANNMSPFHVAKVGSLTKTNTTSKINSNTSLHSHTPVHATELEGDEEGELVEEEEEEHTTPEEHPVPTHPPPTQPPHTTRRMLVPSTTTSPPTHPIPTVPSTVPTRGSLLSRHILAASTHPPAHTTRRPKPASVTPATTPVPNEEEYFYEEKTNT